MGRAGQDAMGEVGETSGTCPACGSRLSSAVALDDVVLGARERETLTLVGQGLRNREIAARMSITEDTVKKHVSRIMGKLGVGSRVGLAMVGRAPPPFGGGQ